MTDKLINAHPNYFLRQGEYEMEVRRKGATKMNEMLIMLGIFGAWIALQAFILPRFGIET